MRTIPLTQGYEAIIDDDDFERVSQYTWFAQRRHDSDSAVYAVRRRPRLPLHRFVMDAPNGMEVDHINGDGLDCRKANLRICTHAQNTRNKTRQRNNKSGYKGVYWKKDRGMYASSITFDKKRRHLGYFADKEDAARAYDVAAQLFFGEFARLNFSSP